MGRPRAGHGRTALKMRSGNYVYYIWSAIKEAWIPDGAAVGWPRCKRCRKPEEPELVVNDLCNTCYYYSMTVEEFWKRQKDKYFPYNIGRRQMISSILQKRR